MEETDRVGSRLKFGTQQILADLQNLLFVCYNMLFVLNSSNIFAKYITHANLIYIVIIKKLKVINKKKNDKLKQELQKLKQEKTLCISPCILLEIYYLHTIKNIINLINYHIFRLKNAF